MDYLSRAHLDVSTLTNKETSIERLESKAISRTKGMFLTLAALLRLRVCVCLTDIYT